MAVNPGEHPVILTPDQRVRVFVSSASELAPERRAVQDAVRRLRLLPVMVEDGARVHPSRDVHRAYLDQSQIFIGVYGDSWGEALDDEFRLSEHLPRLVYVKEPAPARDERLATMLSDIRRDAGLSYRLFTTAAQLRDLVEQDLAVLLSERFDGPAEPSRAAPVAGLPPAVRTPLIGREDDLAALVAMLDTDPLVTLTGPGGVGKTRLALAAADHCGPGFPDGVRFVDLSTVTSPDLVGEALARGLGVRTSGAVPASTDVASWLRTKRMLLVVDNFEQLAAAAPVIGQLQRAAPGVTALVTSRAPLRLAEERVFEVRPLPPPRGADADSPAVRLFVEVARAKVPGFALGPDDLAAVAEITRRLHGLPLAIVLAAAKVRLLPPATLVTHLGDQLGLLTGGARDLPDRQRTLRDTIAWSYRLLRAEEQAVFERLGVFAGGWDLAAAEAVAAPDGDLLDLLEGLIDSTLVRPVTASDGHERFAMLETIREYALERMRGGDQWHTAHAAHAAHYLRVAQAAQPHLNRAQATVWLRRLELERENVNAALDWFLTHDEPTQALRLLWATWSFWWRRGHIDEASRVVARILDHGDLLGDPATGRALLGAGVLSFVSGQPERAEGLFLRALPYLRAAGDERGAAQAAG
ncbi:DUF4062 domain-containing protein, partial [Asanoa sp. NPDC050611]|uniref:ATP-binding protein n=1 Tax=Asanoa sp. NPDC050611 TaxID=3157098 RepID=UPI0033CDB496